VLRGKAGRQFDGSWHDYLRRVLFSWRTEMTSASVIAEGPRFGHRAIWTGAAALVAYGLPGRGWA